MNTTPPTTEAVEAAMKYTTFQEYSAADFGALNDYSHDPCEPTIGTAARILASEVERLRAQVQRQGIEIVSFTGEVAGLRARVAELEAELAKLHTPAAVHINMLRGTIATPSRAMMEHVWGGNGLPKPLPRPDRPGWWWEWDDIAKNWFPYNVRKPELESEGFWLPATPPPPPTQQEDER